MFTASILQLYIADNRTAASGHQKGVADRTGEAIAVVCEGVYRVSLGIRRIPLYISAAGPVMLRVTGKGPEPEAARMLSPEMQGTAPY